MSFTSKRRYVIGSRNTIKYLLSDWELNYNRNYRNKWTTEAVTLPSEDYAIKKFGDSEYNKETGTSLLYYKNPAFILTFIFLVGVFVLPAIFCLLVKLCLKINVCPSYFRRSSAKGTIQPVLQNSHVRRTRIGNNSQINDGTMIAEEGWSSHILNENTHNAITQTDSINTNDCFEIRILEQDGINSLPPSYEEATGFRNSKDNDSNREGGGDGGNEGGDITINFVTGGNCGAE